FFQAEDGIRDGHVTGVQTCALPILRGLRGHGGPRSRIGPCPPLTSMPSAEIPGPVFPQPSVPRILLHAAWGGQHARRGAGASPKIGRASCRERVWSEVVGGGVVRKK